MTRERTVWARHSRAETRIGRLRILALAVAFGYCAVLMRAADVHLHPDPNLKRKLVEREQFPQVEQLRGSFVDRDGRLLLAREDTPSVEAELGRVQDKRRAALALSPILQTPATEIRRRLELQGSRFVWLKRWVSEEQATRVRGLALAGIHVRSERRGKYPNGPLAAPYLGLAGYQEVALEGLERVFDAALSGAPPVGADGAEDRPAGPASGSPLGSTVHVALDAPMQFVAEEILAGALRETGAQHASLLALDPWTGDVLVAAEAPGYDPEAFRSVSQRFRQLRSFVEAFEPGSTLKPFTIAAALEAAVVEPEQTFDCERGRYRVANRTIHDHHPYGVLDVRGILAVSSNIGVLKIAERLGSRRLVSGLRLFGFGSRVATDFPGTSAGIVHDLLDDQVVERATLAFGQGMRASPLQLALATAVLANGGQRVAPRLALAIERHGSREEIPVQLGPRVIREATAREVVHMMEGVVTRGTGTAAALPTHPVAGKTGTAQKVLDGGGYSQDRFVASFIGILPADRPRLVVVVTLDEPRKPKHTGGLAAAPLFQRFAAYAVERLSIPGTQLLIADGDTPAVSEVGPTP